MTDQMIKHLAARFKKLFDKGEDVQWELAEIAYQAVDIEGGSLKAFAGLVDRPVSTIKSYRKAWMYREEGHRDVPFADALLLGNVTPEQAAAIQLVADDNSTSMHTAKSKTEQVSYYRDIFQHADRDVLKEALKDQDSRSRLRELSVETVMDDAPARPKTPTGTSTPAPTKAPSVEEQSAKIKLQRAMNEMMHANRATQMRFITATDGFVAAVPNQWWNRHFPGETVNRTHGEQVIGDLEKTIRILQEQLARVKVAVAEANVDSEKRHERDLERADS